MAVIEKGKTPGAHLLSGANMRPSAMRELFPDMDESEWPVLWKVEKDAVYLLTKKQALPLKPMPPNFRNHGNHVVSVAQLGRWLGEKAEEAGVYILPETTADKLLVEDRIVVGVRTGDKGRDRDGEPALELRARLGRDRQGDGAGGGHARATSPSRRRTTSTCTARTRSAGSWA